MSAQTKQIMTKAESNSPILDQVILHGDLARLSSEDKVLYHKAVCESLGLNPLTKPFEYISLNGKLTLYAKKDCTEQLRKIHGINIEITARELVEDLYIVTARASSKDGRFDEAVGAIVIGHLKGEAKANAIMKAETKAKRRVTLSICGLGILDETEVDSASEGQVINQEITEEAITETELSILRGKITEAESEEIKICQFLEVESIESITKRDFLKVMRILSKKIEDKNKLELPINQILMGEVK